MPINVTDLICARGSVQLTSPLSFTISSGESVLLHGPNGAGKTTLLRTICGLTAQISGNVQISEGSIAYCGHSDAIKGQLTVTENLDFWADIYATNRTGEAITFFDLERLAHRRAGDLSAGQKRRLSLARLMVTACKYWCLDEPNVSLDAENTKRFEALVARHVAGGGAAIIATHLELSLNASKTIDLRDYAPKSRVIDDPFLEALA